MARGRPKKIDQSLQAGLPLDGAVASTPNDATAPGRPAVLTAEDLAAVLVNTGAVAWHESCTEQAVRAAVGAGHLERIRRGTFTMEAVVRWAMYRRSQATQNAESAREELYRAQTAVQELNLAERRGDLGEVAVFEATLVEVLQRMTDLLDAAPARLASEPAEIARLRELTHAARTYLADELEKLGRRRSRRSSGATAAAGATRKSVGRPKTIATRE